MQTLSLRSSPACRTAFVAAGVMLWVALVLWSSAAVAELPKYLDDGCNIVVSIKFDRVYDSPYYRKLRADIAEFAEGEKFWEEENFDGIPLSNVAQVTLTANVTGHGDEPLVAVRTRKPITAKALLVDFKVPDAWKDYTVTETKVGKHTIYEGRFAWEHGGRKLNSRAFAVIDDDVVLLGPDSAFLRRVLDPDKPPKLTPVLKRAAKSLDFDKTFACAPDLSTGIDEPFVKAFNRDLSPFLGGGIDVKVFQKLEALTMEANLDDTTITLRASLIAKDAASGAEIMKLVRDRRSAIRAALKNLPGFPESLLADLDAIALSADGTTIDAKVKVKGDSAVKSIEDLFAFFNQQDKEPSKAKKK